MAKKKKVVQSDDNDGVEYFSEPEEVVQPEQPKRELPKGGINEHSKFDKFKKGNK